MRKLYTGLFWEEFYLKEEAKHVKHSFKLLISKLDTRTDRIFKTKIYVWYTYKNNNVFSVV